MQTKTLTDCQSDAAILSDIIEAIDLMNNEGAMFKNSRDAVTIAALRMANELANDLDRLDPAKMRRAAE